MSHEEPNAELFYRLETSLHHPEVRGSSQQVSNLLADEFVEFGKSGRVYNKQITIDRLAGEQPSLSAPLLQTTDFSVSRLSDEVILVTYKSFRSAPANQVSNVTLRSSIWKFYAGRWQMVFHQGTPVPPV